MKDNLRLMCVTAHPDDESLGLGPALAQNAAEGVTLSIVCATRGERGWFGDEKDNPGVGQLGKIREAELRAAAHVLGVAEVDFLDYMDGEVAEADPLPVIATLARHVRRFKPQVVLTFDPFGAYGHPDHIAICQLTTAAMVAAAHPSERSVIEADNALPHVVSKLYYMADTAELISPFEALAGEISMVVNDTRRHNVLWPEWSITAVIDAPKHWRTVWRAIQCHTTQKHEFEALEDAPEATREFFCRRRTFYRAFSLVNGGTPVETDLFEGLR